MPQNDLVQNADIARTPEGQTSCNCKCDCTSEYQYPQGYWYPGCPPPPPPYPYPCPPVNTGVGSLESQIAKLSKKSAIIRKMIDNLVNKGKDMIISIGCGATYNFGKYLNAEQEETTYGTAVLEVLQAELAAIKAKIIELTGDLDVEETTAGGIEGTVTGSGTTSTPPATDSDTTL